ncbi:hypothetical protein NGA_0405100, partial [Nannochloropsis gaditana CCMP526]|uniref:uncharacterized protein n=1 Tax=Nannochloropsis gaditana (strain CCMP526) TaxID=1093141 RepID=UPI00029F7E45
MEHNTPHGPSQHPLKTKHSVPLLTTAAGLALVTTTTLFSMSASTAAVADVYARTGRVSMAWLCRPPCRSHIPPLSSPSVIPSQGATASQVIPPQHLETKRRRERWAEGMHVLLMTRSRGGMGKGGQEQGEPEGKGGGG